jgi:hypothetical protein
MGYLVRGLRWLRVASPILASLLGAAMLWFFLRMGFWSIVGPIAGFTTGAAITVAWVAVRSLRSDRGERPAERAPLPAQVPVVVTCAFVVSLLVVLRLSLHRRPIGQYALFAGFAGFVAYQIARGASHRRIVPQILTLGFFTYWSSQILFPAGMYAPDTRYRYLPAIHEMLSTGGVPASEVSYAGHLVHAAEFALLTGLAPQTGYFLLSTLLLVATVLLISSLDRVLPVLSRETALFAALFFSVSSWMIGRGMHPNKLNFFYALILLLGLVAFRLYQTDSLLRSEGHRWSVIGLLAMPAIIFGHRFSAGAALLFLLALAAFGGIARFALASEYELAPRSFLTPFVTIYVLAVLGNPLHQQPLLTRLSGLITSIVAPGSGGAGPGRYSELALDVLIASTAAQTILFALASAGAIWAFRQRRWEYDLTLFWIVCLGALLAVALVQNSVDTAPQRFYAMLVLFGFNVTAGAVFFLLGGRGSVSIGGASIGFGRAVVVVLVAIFAVTSLASPVADTATSPVADEIPDFRLFDTAQLNEGDRWLGRYASDERRIVAPVSDVPIVRTGADRGVANRTAIESGRLVAYSELSNRAGVKASGGLSIGGRTFLFVPSPERPADSRIYTNGETTVFLRA